MADKPVFISIKNWSQDDRPREKLRDKGKANLSDAELIAILLGTGSRSESAVSLSQRILSSVDNNLNQLGKLSIKQLMTFRGIGEAKAITIVAAMELGRRRRGEEALEKMKISSSTSVFELMQPIIGELPHEEFWIVYLNNSNKVLHKNQVSKGGITGTLVDVRLVLKSALELGAVGLILAHNHPSGTLKPSTADKDLTKKLKLAAESLDIKVLDHLIITEKAYFSFADENIM
ncbi:JAB domain-containing protein [Subsaximicrobium wynnwilliamsii]|uniref:JAB domain-containing protein n=1 Tax=Subsaximicrobium wynnwilliamsii TaxID=291179 RepID=A0A5C6ZFA2_9FLAO|nr:DNA repair protein RadC [Subsaximicrobium wynnwilliamsii]TXD82288.1 JAB domain-containing protein [Subsaximicrobium wynnwilliamsii]TXD87926.1 JAB domain-containing protein [Subsaximicrobium wynnwilliamsii]TXE01919.1 JAB domain-containing protein [Subsaximicrobium wynnwilliamsii]